MYRFKKVSKNRMSSKRLMGVSALAMAVTLGGPAQAQSAPGSPECPIVDNEVICSGSLQDGEFSTTGASGRATTPVQRFTFRDFDRTIQPRIGRGAIDIVQIRNFRVDIDSNVRIASFDPSGALDAAVAIRANFGLQRDPTVRNTILINNAGLIEVASSNGNGAIRTSYGGSVTVNNTGQIFVYSSGSTRNRDNDGILINEVDMAQVVNSGSITMTRGPEYRSGISDYAIRLYLADVASITNTASGILTGDVQMFGSYDQTFLNDGQIAGEISSTTRGILNPSRNFNYNFTNSGTITGSVKSQVNNFFNSSTISFVNTGIIRGNVELAGSGNQQVLLNRLGSIGGGISYRSTAKDENRATADNISVTIDNRADIGGGIIYFSEGLPTFLGGGQLPTNTRNNDIISAVINNTGNIGSIFKEFPNSRVVGLGVLSSGGAGGAFGNYIIRLNNSGDFANSGIKIDLLAFADSPFSLASFDGRIENTGDVDFIEVETAQRRGFSHGTIVVNNSGRITNDVRLAADRSVVLTNSGASTGITTRQGHGYPPDGGFVSGRSLYASDFDGGTTITNSGTILTQGGSATDAFRVIGTANINISNTASVTTSGATDVFEGEIGSDSVGLIVNGQSDVTITNSGVISATAIDVPADFNGYVGAGVVLNEHSYREADLADLRRLNFLDSSYDYSRDVNSRYLFTTSTNITATGPNMHGIVANVGLIKAVELSNIADNPMLPPDYAAEPLGHEGVYANSLATVTIDIGRNATVSSGTRRGSGVVIAGTGSATLLNAGAIIGNGDESTAALLLTGTDVYGNTLAAGSVVTKLLNSVNSGTITSALGTGIRTDGTITNFVNSGTISGGQMLTHGDRTAIQAAGASSIVNDTRGTIEGDVRLSADSDMLTNRGTINGAVTLGGGDDTFILGTGGNLPAVDGGAGNDRFMIDTDASTTRSFDLATTGLTSFELFSKRGLGSLTLTGTAAATVPPLVTVEAGTLLANAQTPSLAASVASGATLGGNGRLGAVSVADGGILSPGGDTVGTLSVASLALSNGSIARFNLSRADVIGGIENDLVNVTGNLTLDGTLRVIAAPAFGGGVYRIFNYGGTLTDNGIILGVLPDGETGALQTSLAGQVNLVIDGGSNIQFWDGGDTAADGSIDGGTGAWNASATNWTNIGGDANRSWGGGFAVFQGVAGTVMLDPAGLSATGLQFVTSGYRLEGGVLTLAAPAALRVGDGTTAGATTTATIASVIAGSGGIEKTDFGTLVLTGTNTFTGGTRIVGGVLQVVGDGALGAASGGVTLDGGTLRAGGSFSSPRDFTVGMGGGALDPGANTLTLTGTLGGAGSLTVNGTGTLSLTGNSAARTGATRIAGGTLNLSGNLGGPLTIGTGARLTGTGTTGDLTVEGTVAPGNSPGTVNVNGNLVFAAGSTYALELASSGPSDRINVSGTANLTGGTVVVTALDPDFSYANGSRYRFISATGGLIGTFAGLRENSAFLDFALAYGANSVDVNVTVVRTFPEVARTFNQTSAANGLRDLRQTAGSDSLDVFRTILFLDADPARAAFDASSGEIYATTLASSLRHGSILAERLASRAYAVSSEGWGLWGGASGHDGRVKNDGNGARYDHSAIGGNLGVDYRGSGNDWAVGISGGSLDSDVSLTARTSQADSKGWHIGGYMRAGTGGAGFSAVASVAYADSDADFSRNIAFGALQRIATSDAGISSTAASFEMRYGVSVDNWSFGPVAGVEYSHAKLGRFNETGANSLNLTTTGNSDNYKRGSIGAFANLQSARGSIDMSVRYANGGNQFSEIGLSLAGSPTAFRVQSANVGGDAMLARIAGEYALGGGWSLGGDVAATIAEAERTVAGSARLTFRF